METTKADIQEFVTALFAVVGGLGRAQRRIPAASALAVLQVIAGQEGIRPSDIAAQLGLHLSSVTRQVRVLEESGRITVSADPADRRSCLLALTDAGAEEIARLTEVGLGRFATFVADWDPEEVRTFTRLLQKFEASKAAVGEAERERQPGGRRWQQRP